jgi:hypothetical protein
LNANCGASITNNPSDVKSDAIPAASFLPSNSFSRAPSALIAFITSCKSCCSAQIGNEKQLIVRKTTATDAPFYAIACWQNGSLPPHTLTGRQIKKCYQDDV